jgi:hypothetical protein
VRFYDDSGTKKVDITIRNSGTSSAKVVEVYQGTSASSLAPVSPAYDPSQLVSEGASSKITFNLTWTSGTRYHFKVVTEEGLSIPFSEEA